MSSNTCLHSLECKMRYNSEKIIHMIVNYSWKPNHHSQVIEYFVVRLDSKIESFLIIN